MTDHFEAIVTPDQGPFTNGGPGHYDTVERITIHLVEGYSYDLEPKDGLTIAVRRLATPTPENPDD